MSLKIVSFDMNGTLTDDRFAKLVWGEGVPSLYSLAKGMPLDQAKEYVFREYEKVGDEKREWYDISYWFRFFGLGDNWVELLETFKHEIKPFPEASYVLRQLSKDYRLIVITNASREFVDIELGTTGLEPYFINIFSSTSDFSEVKKTPAFYLKVCQSLGIKPGEMAHVGDHHLFDFTVPQELGIAAFYLDRWGNEKGDFIVRDLEEFQQKLSFHC